MTELKDKQEKALPEDDVREVAAGVLRIQLPCDMPGLGHVNCYVLEDNKGLALVDPGFPFKRSISVLRRRLTESGLSVSNVHSVIVTHSHPDHYGGASWLQEESGAEIITHEMFSTPFEAFGAKPVVGCHTEDRMTRLGPWEDAPWGDDPGLNLAELPSEEAERFRAFSKLAEPTRRVHDGEVLRLAGREWTVVHTPGHTDDHICLFDPVEQVLMTGDHVLPTISPNINGVAVELDPLGAYLHSLEKVGVLSGRIETVLPAHGNAFGDLRHRVDEIADHHQLRLDTLREAMAGQSKGLTVNELAECLFQPRSRGRMANTETFAHVEHLALQGVVTRHRSSNGVLRFTLNEG